MKTIVQENFPLQRIDIFSQTQNDYEHAKDKARRLLQQILPEQAWSELEDKGIIVFQGKRGTYIISPYSQTEIRDNSTGRCIAYACLRLSIPAPTYDRLIAEYLILKNTEDFYWETANIFCRSGNEFGIAALSLIAFDVALFVNLLLELLHG
jgi:hypothetical protein